MTEISIPSRLNELVLETASGFVVVTEWDPTDFADDEIKNHFDDFAGITTSEGGLDSLAQQSIDALYNLIVNFRSLSDENRELFAQSLTELSAQAIETIGEQLSVQKRNARKQVIYFLIEFLKINEEVAREENNEVEKVALQKGTKAPPKAKAKKADSSYSWLEWRQCCLNLIFQAVCSEPSYLWNMGVVEENFLRGMWSSSLSILEYKPKGVGGAGIPESKIRGLCVAIITRCSALFGTAAGGGLGALSSALLDSIIRAEHMANFCAEICNKSQATLCRDVLLSVSHLAFTGHSGSGGEKNIGTFIESLAKINPDLMCQHLATLKTQIDSPAHQIRSSLLIAMGMVISNIHKVSEELAGRGDLLTQKEVEKKVVDGDDESDNVNNDDEDNQKEKEVEKEVDSAASEKNIAQLSRLRDSLLDLLTERTHDVSYFTRANVLKVFICVLFLYFSFIFSFQASF